MLKQLLALGLCASVVLTGCAPYTPVNTTPSNPTPIKHKQTANKGYSRDWAAVKQCVKGDCFWQLATRIEGSSRDLFEMSVYRGNIMMSRLLLNLNDYPSSGFVNKCKLYIIIDGEKTFSFNADAYISTKTKHVPVIFIPSNDIGSSLIYHMSRGYTAKLILEGKGGDRVEMEISLMGFTKMMRLATQ